MKTKYVLFLMAFIGSLGGAMVRVETAAGAYEISESFLLLTLFSASFMLGRATAAVWSGKVFDRKYVMAYRNMIISFILLGILTPGYLFVSVEIYLVLRLLFGILSGLSWPVLQSILLSIVLDTTRGRDMSLYFIFGSLGMSTAYLLFGFSTMLISITMGMLLYILVGIMGLVLPRRSVASRRKNKTPQRGGGIKIEFVIIAMELGFVSAILATDTITGLLLLKGFSRIQISLILSVATYISIPISLAASYGLATVSDEFGEKIILAGLTLLMVFSVIVFIYTSGATSIMISIILLRVFARSFRPILLGLAKSTMSLGSNIGAMNASHNIFTTTLSPIVGVLIEAQLPIGIAVLTLGVALLSLIHIRKLS